MRTLSAALALSLLAAPAFARGRSSSKGPRAGGYCAKSAVGTTTTDSKGTTLECKAHKRGRARWTKKESGR
jgi:hypothetical protein